MRRYDLYIRDILENIEKAQHFVGGMDFEGDRLIHGYFGVNPKTVWITVVKDLPPLKGALKRILKEEGDET
ncbi:HepT-like ribonuclease domain-containing protein [Thermococcus sp.]